MQLCRVIGGVTLAREQAAGVSQQLLVCEPEAEQPLQFPQDHASAVHSGIYAQLCVISGLPPEQPLGAEPVTLRVFVRLL